MSELFNPETGILSQQILWGVEIWRLGAALLIFFLSFLSRRVLKLLFGGFLKKRVGKTRVQWDDDLVELTASPLGLVAQILLWYMAAAILVIPTEPYDIRLFVFQGLKVAIAIAFTWIVFRLIDVLARVMTRITEKTESRLDDQLVPLLRKTLKVFIAVVVGITIIQLIGYDALGLLASLGIGGVALALAAKDTVANFFGSLIVFTDQPFQVGDAVQIGSLEGVVEEVGFRTTHVRLYDKTLATVPNQTFTTTTIINHSRRPMRRIRIIVGLSYEAEPEQVQTFVRSVRDLLTHHDAIDTDSYAVYFQELGASSLNVLVNCFSKSTDYADYMEAQEDILLRMMRLVDEQGLELAFPTRTVYFRDERWGEDKSKDGQN